MVVGGGRIYHGAPIFSALAAYRSGVDIVYVATPEKISQVIRSISPSLIVFPLPDVKLTGGCVNIVVRNVERGTLKIDSAVIGPGLSGKPTEIGLLAYKLSNMDVKLVLDASALRNEVLKRISGKKVVLTPHEGEFQLMFGVKPESELEKRAEIVKRFAEEFKVVILLKGPQDIISDGKEIYVNKTGNAGMTVGGTGDVLSGLTAGFMARGVEPLKAAVIGAYINGLAGDRVASKLGFHFLAEDLIDEIPLVLKEFDRLID